jgi:hypothetical protein
MRKVDIPIAIKPRGEVYFEVRDVRTGKIKETRKFKNMLLNNYLDGVFAGGVGRSLLGWKASGDSAVLDQMLFGGKTTNTSSHAYCRLGSGDTAPARTQTGLVTPIGIGQVLADPTKASQSLINANPVYVERAFVFPALHTVSDSIKEVGLWGSTHATPTSFPGELSNHMVARQLVTPTLELTETDELTVKWRIYMDFGSQVSTGTIVGAQYSTGEDINWRATINNAQMMDLCRTLNATNTNTYDNTANRNPLQFLNSTNATQNDKNIRLGSSNAASDLAADGLTTLKGTQHWTGSYKVVKSGVNLYSHLPYTSGAPYEREIKFGWEYNDPDTVEVGELVVDNVCRITFTDADTGGGINKAALNRLFINLKFTLDPGV